MDLAVKRSRLAPQCAVAALGGFLLLLGLTGPLSADLRLVAGQWALLTGYAVIGAFMTVHDLRERRLPDAFTLPLATGLAGGTIAVGLLTGDLLPLAAAAGGALCLAFLLTLGGLAGQVGFGDVKLALSIGLLTGFHAWYAPFLALALAPLLALPHALIGLDARRRGRHVTDLPFGPYLIGAGALVSLFLMVS